MYKVIDILKFLEKNPVIPCIHEFEDVLTQEFNNINIVFLRDLDIFDLINVYNKNLKAKKVIIIHLDSIKGICCDKYGLTFIRKYFSIISSASPKILHLAKHLDYITIQSIFLFDGKSVEKAVELVKDVKPDFFDIRPAIAFLETEQYLKNSLKDIPVICSGLLYDSKYIKKVLENKKVVSVTTSRKEFWKLFI